MSESQQPHTPPRPATTFPRPIPLYRLVRSFDTQRPGPSQAGPSSAGETQNTDRNCRIWECQGENIARIGVQTNFAPLTDNATKQALGASQAEPSNAQQNEMRIAKLLGVRPAGIPGQRSALDMQAAGQGPSQGPFQALQNNVTQHSSPAENGVLQEHRSEPNVPARTPAPEQQQAPVVASAGDKRAANDEPVPGPSNGGPSQKMKGGTSQKKKRCPSFCINCIQKNRRVNLYEQHQKKFEKDMENQDLVYNKIKSVFKTTKVDLKKILSPELYSIVKSNIHEDIEEPPLSDGSGGPTAD